MKYEKNIFTDIANNLDKFNVIINNQWTVAVYDKFPKAKNHILIIPKNNYINFADFLTKANNHEKIDLFLTIEEIIHKFNLENNGFKLIINNNKSHGQEILHLHIHILNELYE